MQRVVLSTLAAGFLLLLTSPAGATDLRLRKIASAPSVIAGDFFTYTFEVDNTSTFGGGPLNSPNTILTDVLPPQIRFVSATPDQGMCTISGQNLTCNLGTVPAFDIVSVLLTVEAVQPGTVMNEATVEGGLFDPDPENNSANETVVIEERVPVSDVSLTKTASAQNVDVGGSLTYTLVVHNDGPDEAIGVIVSDLLPTTPDGAAAVDFVGAGGDCVEDSGVVTCQIDEILPGESVTIVINTTVLVAGEITNSASAAEENDPNDANNSDSATVTATEEQADISVSKIASRLAFVSEDLVYTINVTNNGPDDATGVSVTDVLPTAEDGAQAFTVSSIDPAGECSVVSGTLNCDFPNLPRGETQTIKLIVTPIIRSTYINTATVTTTDPTDPDLSNNADAAVTYVTRHGATTANMPLSEDAADPVSTASGEFYLPERADLYLGGPLPLFFARYYGSNLSDDERISTTLGPNWSHSFGWRVVVYDDEAVEAVTGQGRILPFEKRDGEWIFLGSAVAPYQLRSEGSELLLSNPRSGGVHRFDAAGRLLEVSDRNGNAHVLTYQGEQLTAVEDGLGRTLNLTYVSGRLASVSDGSRTVRFSYTARGELGSVENAVGEITTYRYDDEREGLLVEVDRSDAPTLTQEYDADDRVTVQADGLGGTTQLVYAADRTTVTNAEGEVVRHHYDDGGRLVEMVDGAGRSIHLEYDEAGRRAFIEDRTGLRTTIEYHEPTGFASSVSRGPATTGAEYAAREVDGFEYFDVVSLTLEDGSAVTYERDVRGNATAVIDESGERTEATYNDRGQPLTVVSEEGATSRFTYRTDGLLESVISPDGGSVTFAYDALGRPNLITYPDGTTRQFEFDAADRLTGYINEAGDRVEYGFAAGGNISRITAPEGRAIELSYGDNGQVAAVTDRGGHTSSVEYDQLGRAVSITNPLMETIRFGYDDAGRLSAYVDAAGQSWTLEYDDEDLLVGTADPLGHFFRLTRDDQGRVINIERPDGSSLALTRDSRGRITSAATPTDGTATFSYDAEGSMSAASLPGGGLINYARNASGNLTSLSGPLGDSWTFDRDAMGRIVTDIDPIGNSTSLSYDARGFVSRVDLPGTAGTISYVYDALGNPARVDHSDGTSFTYEYDADRQLISATGVVIERDANGSVIATNGLRIGRDALRRIESIDFPAGSVTYRYDAVGNVREIEDWLGGITTFSYDAARRRTSIARSNGVHSAFVYDAMSRFLSETTSGADGESLWSIEVQRDASGRITQSTVSPALAPRPGALERTRTFDEAYRDQDFSYDDLGRRTADDLRTYEWTGAARLAAYRTPDGSVNFSYDALGRRISRSDSVGTKTYTWNDAFSPAVVSIEKNFDGSDRYYVHLPDGELLYFIDVDSGRRHYYHFDPAGSTLFLTDDSGEIAAAYAYSPYGRPSGVIGDVSNPFTYHGRSGMMHDSDGLYYARARYYDASSAQFISRDPLRTTSPNHVNPYQFVAGDPVSFSDPTGLDEVSTNDVIETTSTIAQDILSGTNMIIDYGLGTELAGNIERAADQQALIKVLEINEEAAKEVGKLTTVLDVVGNTLTFGVEWYQSGNILRGGGAVAADLALGSNPVTAIGSIASDVVDLGASVFGVTPLKLKEPITNGGRLLGAAATDLVATTGVLGERRTSSLTQLAKDIDGQDGLVPMFLSDTGETLTTGLGLDDLFGDQNIEKIRLDAEVEQLKRDKAQAALQKFLLGGN